MSVICNGIRSIDTCNFDHDIIFRPVVRCRTSSTACLGALERFLCSNLRDFHSRSITGCSCWRLTTTFPLGQFITARLHLMLEIADFGLVGSEKPGLHILRRALSWDVRTLYETRATVIIGAEIGWMCYLHTPARSQSAPQPVIGRTTTPHIFSRRRRIHDRVLQANVGRAHETLPKNAYVFGIQSSRQGL